MRGIGLTERFHLLVQVVHLPSNSLARRPPCSDELTSFNVGDSVDCLACDVVAAAAFRSGVTICQAHLARTLLAIKRGGNTPAMGPVMSVVLMFSPPVTFRSRPGSRTFQSFDRRKSNTRWAHVQGGGSAFFACIMRRSCCPCLSETQFPSSFTRSC